MAYDANGNWINEDDSTANQLNKLTSSDSPYIQQARQSGLETANTRGLLNSSIAAGASQGAAINAATPIASADANIAANKNLSAQGFGQTTKLNTQQNQAAAAQQQAQIAASKELQGGQITSTEKLAQAQLDAQNAQQQRAIASQEKQTTEQLTSQQQIALQNINANANLAQLDTQTKLQIAAMDTDTQTKIANLNVSAGQQKDAMNAAVAYSSVYAQELAAINSNPNIPAAERSSLLQSAQNRLNANIGLVQSMYNVDLNWGNTASPFDAGTAAAATPATVPTPAQISAATANYGRTAAFG